MRRLFSTTYILLLIFSTISLQGGLGYPDENILLTEYVIHGIAVPIDPYNFAPINVTGKIVDGFLLSEMGLYVQNDELLKIYASCGEDDEIRVEYYEISDPAAPANVDHILMAAILIPTECWFSFTPVWKVSLRVSVWDLGEDALINVTLRMRYLTNLDLPIGDEFRNGSETPWFLVREIEFDDKSPIPRGDRDISFTMRVSKENNRVLEIEPPGLNPRYNIFHIFYPYTNESVMDVIEGKEVITLYDYPLLFEVVENKYLCLNIPLGIDDLALTAMKASSAGLSTYARYPYIYGMNISSYIMSVNHIDDMDYVIEDILRGIRESSESYVFRRIVFNAFDPVRISPSFPALDGVAPLQCYIGGYFQWGYPGGYLDPGFLIGIEGDALFENYFGPVHLWMDISTAEVIYRNVDGIKVKHLINDITWVIPFIQGAIALTIFSIVGYSILRFYKRMWRRMR